MNKLFLFVSMLFVGASFAQTGSITPGASLLFQNVKTKLTPAEKNHIYKQLGFLLSKDKKQFIPDAEAADFPFAAFVYPTDLNKDGKEEIFVSFGNSYTSGHTGQSIALFIKDATGKYKMHFGFPGMVPYAMAAAANKYPDLIVGGPGFTFPVYRWNGKAYTLNRNISDQNLTKLKPATIEDVSKAYTATIK